MRQLKTGSYIISVWNKRLIYRDPFQDPRQLCEVDVSYMVDIFGPFLDLGIDAEKDIVNLICDYDMRDNKKTFYFVKFPISAGSLEPKIEASDVLCEDVEVIDTYIKKEERKMEEIKTPVKNIEDDREGLFDVFDGPLKLAGELELDIALCLIDGYIRRREKDPITGISIIPSDKSEWGIARPSRY